MAKLQRFEGFLVDLLEDPEVPREFPADLSDPLLPTARAYLQNWIHGHPPWLRMPPWTAHET